MADFLDTSSRIWILDNGGRVCTFLETSGQFFIWTLEADFGFWTLGANFGFFLFIIYLYFFG